MNVNFFSGLDTNSLGKSYNMNKISVSIFSFSYLHKFLLLLLFILPLAMDSETLAFPN